MASLAQSARRDTGTLLSWLSLATVWIVWGSTFLGIRVAVESIPPFLMAGTRFVIAGTVLSAIMWLAQGKRRQRLGWAEWRAVILSAVLLLVLGNGLLSYAEVRLPSGVAALLVATVPIWMLIIDAVLSRKISPLAVLGIVLGTFGIAELVGAPSSHVPLRDAFLVMFGSLSWAIGSVIARRDSAHRLNPLFPALEMAVAGALMCAIGAASGELRGFHIAQVTSASWTGFAYLITVGGMLGYTAYAYAVRTLPTNIVATYAYVNPIVAVFLGALLLHEVLSWNVAIGGAAIVLAVVAIMAAPRLNAKPAQTSTVARYDNETVHHENAACSQVS